MKDDELLAEQRAYYRARAPECDEWWQRRGRFDRGSDSAEEWDRQVAQVAAALETFGATGRVVELAGGTGWWTTRLASTARPLTVIDSSPEALEIQPRPRRTTRRGLPRCRPLHLAAGEDLRGRVLLLLAFACAGHAFFWSLLRSCLAPGGRVFLIDNRNDPHPTGDLEDPYVVRRDRDLDLRRLHDRSEFQVIEFFYVLGSSSSAAATLSGTDPGAPAAGSFRAVACVMMNGCFDDPENAPPRRNSAMISNGAFAAPQG